MDYSATIAKAPANPAGFAPAAPAIALDVMNQNARRAAQFLRSIANPHRLMILCHLTHGEASVGQLERELGIRQAHLSQQLARLRRDGLVNTRRASRLIYYSLGSDEAREIVATMYRVFCAPEGAQATV